MKSSTLFGALALVVIAILVYMLLPASGSQDEAWRDELIKDREEKDNFMKSSGSPLPPEERTTFKGLSYFEPNPAYRITAELVPIKPKKVVELGTSTGEVNRYLEFAWAVFTLDGTEQRLLILEVMDMGPTRGQLFLAFADGTSAGETYGAGRYIDVRKIPGATTVELDFNKAYNPYCAYTDKYSCPFPPRENVLKSAIRAGEKSLK